MSADTKDQEPSFRTKILTSVKLSSLKFASDIVLRLVSTVILTRLLAPEIYGVFALVLVYMYLLEMFSDLGLRSIILTKEGEVEDDFLRTCWTVSILRGGLIAAVSCLIGLTIGVLQARGVFPADNPYAAPALPWAIVSLGAGAFLLSFQSPLQYISERNMSFERVTILAIFVNIFGIIATIGLALYLRSVWALVLGSMTKNLAQLVLSYLLFPGTTMRLRLNKDHLKIVIGRGKWIIGHSVLTALSQTADRFMLGFVMTSTTFGFYFIARQLVDMVSQFLATIEGQIGLQVFTHLQKSTVQEFRRNYYRFRMFFDALAGLSAGGIIILAPTIVEIIFDDRYRDVAPMAQVLVLAVLLTGSLLLRSAYSAERRFKEMTYQSVLSTLTLWIGLVFSIMVLDSTELALFVIALHRLPEALIFFVLGYMRGWVVPSRETLIFVFCGLGIMGGLALEALWEALA